MMAANKKPKMLIMSFSDIRSDARVLKQVNLFKDDWDVTTYSYGEAPDGVAHHISIPKEDQSLDLDGALINFERYRKAYWGLSLVRAANRDLGPYKGQFDVILANETDTVPVAIKLKPRWGIHADLHEYTPSLKEENPAWDERIKPFHNWVISTYVSQANSWTSPGDGVGDKYKEVFGFRPDTVRNVAPFHGLEPTEVKGPIRIVHHGGAQWNRRPDVMIEGVRQSSLDATFDLFLTPVSPEVLAEVEDMTKDDPRIHVHPAIPYHRLIETINQYDLGMHILPPVNFNNENAVPNKIFDFVQARLGQVVSPNPEMAKTIHDNQLGAVTSGIDAASIAEALNEITVEKVIEWKEQAHRKAKELSAENEVGSWADAIEALAREKPAANRRNSLLTAANSTYLANLYRRLTKPN